MVTLARKKIDADRAVRNSMVRNPVYSEVVYDGLRIPVVSTSRPAHENVNAHNVKNCGGVRMMIISLPRVSCLERDDD